jgi:nucleotide-binding universal stress UspA family protein
MFKCILVGLDGSKQSVLALKYAEDLAGKYGAKIVLVHVYPHTSDLRDYEEYDKLVAKRMDNGQKILESARNHLGEISIEIEEDLIEEPAADALLLAAETHHADLILLGSRGMGSLKSLLFGSVSTKVTHYASCPVMIVR